MMNQTKRYLATYLFVFSTTLLLAQTFAVKADKLIDGYSNVILDNPLVITSGRRIVDVKFDVEPPDSAELIDLSGYTILPGLIDAHTHLLYNGGEYEDDIYKNSASYRSLRAVSHLKISLENGFTTLRDVCTEGAGYADVDLVKAMWKGFIVGPRIITATKGIAATGSYYPSPWQQNWNIDLPSGTEYVSGIAECIKAVREQISRGAQWIKVFADWGTVSFSQEELTAIVEEAGRHNTSVAAHATSGEGINMAIRAGVRSIEHGDGFNDTLMQMAIDNDVFWCPTISAYEEEANLTPNYEVLKQGREKGVKIVLGSDVGSFDWTINQVRELEYYVNNAGFSPMEAIKSGTSLAAELLGLEKELGKISKGYIADIIAVKGNPLDDISQLENVVFVMKEGKVYKQP